MTDTLVLGGNWGDEGKGKVVDYLAKEAKVVVKPFGGGNSGHNLIHQQQSFVTHMLPDGVLHPHITNIITQGVLVDVLQTIKEVDELRTRGINLDDRLYLSHNAAVTLESDRAQDVLDSGNGSTNKGMRYGYGRQMRPRRNIKIVDLFEKVDICGRVSSPRISAMVENAIRTLASEIMPNIRGELARIAGSAEDTPERREMLSGLERAVEPENQKRVLLESADRIQKYIADTSMMIGEFVRSDVGIIYAGSQSILLDRLVGLGTDRTSSLSSGLGLFADIGYTYTREEQEKLCRLGVFKHLPTRVGRKGHGFPTMDEEGLGYLRDKGFERGATTGRPRELGHPDAVVSAYSVKVAGLDGMVYLKMDLVDGVEQAKLATYYVVDGGSPQRIVPTASEIFDSKRIRPVYKSFEGWNGVAGKTSMKDMPQHALNFLAAFENEVSAIVGRKVPIVFIGTGREREECIDLRSAGLPQFYQP